jgi:DNA-directed RNA polymerase delta subunit
MEEMEITSWLTLDAIKKSKAAEIVESVGNLQTDHTMSVFCVIEDDHLELCYSDSAANTLRRYEDRDEFDEALEERKEEAGEAHFEEDEDRDYDEDEKDEDEEEEGPGAELEDETEAY